MKSKRIRAILKAEGYNKTCLGYEKKIECRICLGTAKEGSRNCSGCLGEGYVYSIKTIEKERMKKDEPYTGAT